MAEPVGLGHTGSCTKPEVAIVADKKGTPKQKTLAKAQKPTEKAAGGKAKAAPKKARPKVAPKIKPLLVKGVSRAKLKRTYDKYAPMLRGLPGVVSVGIGLKRTNGNYRQHLEGIAGDVGIPAIVIFVKEKPTDEQAQMKPGDPGFIPDTLDGVPTDVEPVPTMKLAQNGITNPLVGGAKIAPDRDLAAWGTLGVVVRNDPSVSNDPDPNAAYYLTCSHVAFGNDQQGAADTILQPPVNGAPHAIGTPGRNGLNGFGNRYDAATIRPNGNRPHVEGALLPFPGVTASAEIVGATEPTFNLDVMKVGAATALTQGTIRIERGAAAFLAGVNRFFSNLIKIEGLGGPFAAGGDSGSVVFFKKSKTTLVGIGLLVGISEQEGNEPEGKFVYAQPFLLQAPDGEEIGILASLGVTM